MMAENLDDLLKEFNTATASPPPAQPQQPAPPQQQVQQAEIERDRRDAQVAESAHQRNTRALSEAVQRFKADGLSGESDVVVEGFILAKARRDPAFNEALSSGDARRAETALAAARRDYQAEIGGNYIESDRERARASVRGSAKEEPPELSPLPVSRLSDQEYASYIATRIGASLSPYGKSAYWSGDSRSTAARPWDGHDKPGAGGGPQSHAPARARPIVGRGR
jgi:hypothetical protein